MVISTFDLNVGKAQTSSKLVNRKEFRNDTYEFSRINIGNAEAYMSKS
jgi:hypothetical protein